ncbi:MAG TPA: cation transporter [Candidatus Limnocylindrales bacterium]|nr:cation transporter [Candidatus Limnocylindrales bacterium]
MDRHRLLRRALELSALSVGFSGVVGILAVAVGLTSGRLALLGFGFDAAIDSIASVVLFWRFVIERTHPHHAERAESISEVIVSAVLVVLAIYLAYGAIQALASGAHPAATEVGVAISLVSLVVLPPLALAKRRVAIALRSGALRGDSILTGIAAILALVSLLGFVLTEALGVAGADAISGLVIAGFLAREGIGAFVPGRSPAPRSPSTASPGRTAPPDDAA